MLLLEENLMLILTDKYLKIFKDFLFFYFIIKYFLLNKINANFAIFLLIKINSLDIISF